MQRSGGELINTFRQFLQFALRIRSEVDERHQKPADEEKRVDAERSIGDCLEEKFLFDHFPQFHVVGVLKGNDACVTENDPRH